eukprot:4665722-Pleurochrysis_carterae.AAC.2
MGHGFVKAAQTLPERLALLASSSSHQLLSPPLPREVRGSLSHPSRLDEDTAAVAVCHAVDETARRDDHVPAGDFEAAAVAVGEGQAAEVERGSVRADAQQARDFRSDGG